MEKSKSGKPVSHSATPNYCEVCLSYAKRGEQGNIKKQKVLMYRVYGPGLPSEGKEMCKRHWEEYEAESDESYEDASESSEDRQEFTIRPQGHSAVPNTCEVCLAYAKKEDIGKIKKQKVLMYRVYGPGLSESGKEVCKTHKKQYE